MRCLLSAKVPRFVGSMHMFDRICITSGKCASTKDLAFLGKETKSTWQFNLYPLILSSLQRCSLLNIWISHLDIPVSLFLLSSLRMILGYPCPLVSLFAPLLAILMWTKVWFPCLLRASTVKFCGIVRLVCWESHACPSIPLATPPFNRRVPL